jgi:hypothetical protein
VEDLGLRRAPVVVPVAGPDWRNVMLYKDDAPSVEVGVLVTGSFAPAGRARTNA